MTADKYYAIDLGTTNSLIGAYEGDRFQLFQNKDRMNATPSAVYVRTAELIIVGQKAVELIKEDPNNGAMEFKRNMGRIDTVYFPKANIELSSTELSAEVLRSLSNEIRRLRGDEGVKSAVITVPASFGVGPCQATVEAAKLAGICETTLIQEPVAAAIAYGVQPGIEEENWLVFDLGGGTFDVAVVSTRDMHLTVISHAGDRYLGGKDIDRALVEKVILPHLKSRYKLHRAGTKESQALYAKLLRKAEDAKIALCHESNYLVDLFNLGDAADGQQIETEITITHNHLEKCSEDLINRCIDLSITAMEEARIKPQNVDRVLLVGGSTQMPYIRNKVREKLGVEVDFSRDPITAIVEGAAFFGLTQDSRMSVAVGGLNLSEFAVSTVVDVLPSDSIAVVRGLVKGIEQEMEIAVSSGSGWISDWTTVGIDGGFDLPITLDTNKQILIYELKLRYKDGPEVSLKDNHITVNRAMSLENPKLQHSLWIEVDDSTGDKYDLVFKRGTSLPAERMDLKYQISRNLTSTSTEEYLPVKIWEGEDKENLELVGIIQIVKGSGILIQGQALEISFSIDESRILKGNIFVADAQVIAAVNVTLPDEMNAQQRYRILNTRLASSYDLIEKLKPSIIPSTKIEKEFQKSIQSLEKLHIEIYTSRENAEEIDRLSLKERGLSVQLRKLKDDILAGQINQESIYEQEIKVALDSLEVIKGKTGDEQLEERLSRVEKQLKEGQMSPQELGLKLEQAKEIYFQGLKKILP